MNPVFRHPRLGEVLLVRAKRSRRITIRVRAEGAVRLSYPYFVSRARALEFLDTKIDWVERTRERLAAKEAARPPREPLPEAERKARIEELRRQAHADLPPRVARISRELGLEYKGLTIRIARSKWGCCTARNTLSLSLFLMLLPEHLRDYVIVHELCHTVHHNHSARFHALVDRCLSGREKALARELRQHTIDL